MSSVQTPLRHDTSNREGHSEFDIHWHDPEPASNAFTSVIRVKNESRSLPWVLPGLFRVSERVVFIDNGSDDGTPELAQQIAKEEGADDRFELLHYPFSVGRCGPEHLSIPPDSVHSLAYFYNWSFSHVRTQYGLKWDGDMVITEDGERYFRNLAWQVRHIEAMIRIPRYPVYIESDSVAYVDGSMKNFEPWAWPNGPGFHLIKAFEWELISTPPGMHLLTMPEWTCFELKWLDANEFEHWSEGTDFFASKRTERKAREWQVYHASQSGEVLEGVHRVEAPAGVNVIDFLRRPEAVKYARIFLQTMPVHLMHLSKTGGSAIKNTIRAVMRTQDLEPLSTPYGPLKLHGHMWRLHRLNPGKQQKVAFVLRDPVSRFGSGFYSRLRQGRPLMDNPWSEGERVAFESFKTPQELGQALAGDGPDRAKAVFAMEHINHLRWPQISWIGSVDVLRERRSHVLYIGRQESLDDDWAVLRSMLALPDTMVLPTDDKLAHRGNTGEDRSLTEEAAAAVREWYAEDYRLIEYCEEIRAELRAEIESSLVDPAT